MSNDSGWINGAVEIVRSKTGKNIINVKKDLNLKKGQRIILKSFEDDLNQLVEKGIISENEANERLTKLAFIKMVGTVAPMDKQESSDF